MEDIIDARGLMCPLPVLKLGKVMRRVPVGTVVTIWADDPIAVIDIPHFCVEAKHRLVSQTDEGAYQIYVIERLTQ
ncbi:MAG: sulfurtransferase TusA family protein [Octadecabacter sp.]